MRSSNGSVSSWRGGVGESAHRTRGQSVAVVLAGSRRGRERRPTRRELVVATTSRRTQHTPAVDIPRRREREAQAPRRRRRATAHLLVACARLLGAVGHLHRAGRDGAPVADDARVGRQLGAVHIAPRLVEAERAVRLEHARVLEEALGEAVERPEGRGDGNRSFLVTGCPA